MLGSEQLDPQIINLRYGRQCKEAADKHFADLVPPRHRPKWALLRAYG
jgi:hypothetical protein